MDVYYTDYMYYMNLGVCMPFSMYACDGDGKVRESGQGWVHCVLLNSETAIPFR